MWSPNSGQGLDIMINIKKLWKEKVCSHSLLLNAMWNHVDILKLVVWLLTLCLLLGHMATDTRFIFVIDEGVLDQSN